MPTPVVVGGITYPVPLYNESGWAQGAGNLSQLLIALAANISSSPAFMQLVSVTGSPQALVSGHTYMVQTSVGPITLNLPTPAANSWFFIKDISGAAQTNNMTLVPPSGNIDGASGNKILSIPYELCLVVSNGTDFFILLEV